MTGTVSNTTHAPWLAAAASTAPPTPTRAERLTRGLEAHQAAEAQDVATCQLLQQQVPYDAVSLLLDLMVDDAQRHQALLQTMIERIDEDSVGETPKLRSDTAAITSLRALIRDQHEGARYLRHLGRQEPALHDGLFAMLLEGMARDSEKHATMLRYLLRRLEEHGA